MVEPAIDLSGKRVLITGGAGGVGRAVAARMAEQGARLLLTDRDSSDLDRVAGEIQDSSPTEVHLVAADLSARQGIAHLFAELDERLGGIDLLVACAGVGSGPLMEMDEPGWRYVIESNLSSYVACTQGAIERMRRFIGDLPVLVQRAVERAGERPAAVQASSHRVPAQSPAMISRGARSAPAAAAVAKRKTAVRMTRPAMVVRLRRAALYVIRLSPLVNLGGSELCEERLARLCSAA